MEIPTVHLEEQHPVDEALGCMVPFSFAAAGLFLILVKFLAF